MMTDATAEFFDALVERGHESLLEKATVTVRFDLPGEQCCEHEHTELRPPPCLHSEGRTAGLPGRE